jgi:hypothetical protein
VSARTGHTLAELLAALPLAMLLMATLLATFVAQARLARALADRMGRAETERLAAGVLRQELRWIERGDVAAAVADSLTLRLLRGIGVTCGTGTEAMRIDYWGLREPNPEKDSVIIVSAEGESSARLLGSEPTSPSCREGAARLLRLSTPARPGVVLIYERASYHLSARALRVRAGAEGRQPITEEWLEDAGTGLLIEGDDTLPRGVVLHLRGAPARTWRWALPNAVAP